MKLKVGDKIYFLRYGKYPIGLETIIKETPKMYKTKNYTLQIEGEYIRIRGKRTWDRTTAHLANETLNNLWNEQKIINWFDNKKFTVEEKIKIYNLFNTTI